MSGEDGAPGNGRRRPIPMLARVCFVVAPFVVFGALFLTDHLGRHHSVGKSVASAVPALIALGLGDVIFFFVIRPRGDR